jgi:hypothetical protein
MWSVALRREPGAAPHRMAGRILGGLSLFVVFAALLGFGLGRCGIAEAFADPVSAARAQDESPYANSALRMASRGGWMTPKFMGRYVMTRPPLLVWMSALSLKLWGFSRFALRLPVLLAGASATLLLFFWVEQAHSLWNAVVCALLLIADPMWHTYSRIANTDMLLGVSIIVALLTFLHDSALSRTRSILVFAAALAAGIMAKNVAGLLPLATVAVFHLLTGRRPASSLWKAAVLGILLAAPWHIYQLAAHSRWFWTDYVQIQLLGFGFRPPVASVEGPLQFYGKRLALTDPVLCLLALLALPLVVRAALRHKEEAALLLAWLLVAAASLGVFQYRNLPYVLQLIPPLPLVAARYGPLSLGHRPKALAAALAAIFCAKIVVSGPAWALTYGRPAPLPAAEGLRYYSRLSRSNELIAVNPDDEFSATVLPLPRVRYCFIDTKGVILRYAPHYGYLGITVSAAQFDEIEKWMPVFRRRLRGWGLNSIEPVGTAIVADSAATVAHLVATHPRTDFYMPAELRSAVEPVSQASHRLVKLATGRFFLLAFDSSPATGKLVRLE